MSLFPRWGARSVPQDRTIRTACCSGKPVSGCEQPVLNAIGGPAPSAILALVALAVALTFAGCDLAGTRGPVVAASTVSTIAGDDSGNLYADAFLKGQVGRTADGGATWQVKTVAKDSGVDVVELLTRNGVVIAATEGVKAPAGVFMSENQGKRWTSIENGLPPDTSYFIDIAADSAGKLFATIGGRIYTTNYAAGTGELTWTDITPPQDFYAYTLRSDAANRNQIYAGGDGGVRVWQGGENWAKVGDDELQDVYVWELYAEEGELWAGTQSGSLFAYEPDTKAWSAAYLTENEGPVQAIASLPDGTICAGWDRRLLIRCVRSSDKWSTYPIQAGAPADGGENPPGVRSLYVTDYGKIYAGLFEGLVESSDGGKTWQQTISYPIEVE